jgi:hypothetical protein
MQQASCSKQQGSCSKHHAASIMQQAARIVQQAASIMQQACSKHHAASSCGRCTCWRFASSFRIASPVLSRSAAASAPPPPLPAGATCCRAAPGRPCGARLSPFPLAPYALAGSLRPGRSDPQSARARLAPIPARQNSDGVAQ